MGKKSLKLFSSNKEKTEIHPKILILAELEHTAKILKLKIGGK